MKKLLIAVASVFAFQAFAEAPKATEKSTDKKAVVAAPVKDEKTAAKDEKTPAAKDAKTGAKVEKTEKAAEKTAEPARK
jgi:hypothetical protein